MKCVALMACRGKVHVQLLYALGAYSTPPTEGAASYSTDPGGGDSRRLPIDGPLKDLSLPVDRGSPGS